MKQSLFLLALICSVFAGYAGVPYVTYPYDSRAVALTNPANKFAGNGGFLSNITFSAYAARAGAATDATNLWSGGHFASPIFTLDSLNAGTAWRIGGSGGLFVTGDDNAGTLTVVGDIIAQGGAFKGDVVASTFNGLIVPGSATNGAGSRVAYLSDITGGAATNVVWPAIGTNTFMDTNGAVVTVSSMTDTGVVSILASQAIVTNLSTTLSNRTGNLFIWVAGFPFAFTSTGFLQTDYLIATNGLLMGGPLTQYGGATATFSGLVGGTNGFYAGWGGSYAGKSILTNANGAPLVDDYTAQRGSAILTNLQNGDGSSLQSIRGDRINVKFGAAGSTNGATGQVTVTPGTGSGTTNAFDTNAFTLFAKNLTVGTNLTTPTLSVQNAYVTNLLDGSGNPWGSGITTNVSTTLSNNTANLFVWVAGFPFTFTSSGYAGIGTLLATNGIISGGPVTVEAGDVTVANKVYATNGFVTVGSSAFVGNASGATNYLLPFINASEFGVSTNSSDNSAALNAALKFCGTNNLGRKGGTVVLGAGTFTCLSGINAYAGTMIVGQGGEATALWFPNAVSNSITFMTNGFDGSNDILKEGVVGVGISGDYTTVTNTGDAIYFEGSVAGGYYPTPVVRDVRMRIASRNGIHSTNAINGVIENCRIERVAGDGIRVDGAGTGFKLSACYSALCARAGVWLQSLSYSTLTAMASDSNGQGGYVVTNCTGVSLIGCGAEQDHWEGFRVAGGTQNSLIGCTAYGGGLSGNSLMTNAVVIDHPSGCLVQGGNFGSDTNYGGYAVYLTPATQIGDGVAVVGYLFHNYWGGCGWNQRLF